LALGAENTFCPRSRGGIPKMPSSKEVQVLYKNQKNQNSQKNLHARTERMILNQIKENLESKWGYFIES
jgi:hypothetical protein